MEHVEKLPDDAIEPIDRKETLEHKDESSALEKVTLLRMILCF